MNTVDPREYALVRRVKISGKGQTIDSIPDGYAIEKSTAVDNFIFITYIRGLDAQIVEIYIKKGTIVHEIPRERFSEEVDKIRKLYESKTGHQTS